MTGRQRLVGWKAIAEYLGKDVRTLLRWEKERGLPVHRPPGGRGQSVYALPEELDRWIAQPAPEPQRTEIPEPSPAAIAPSRPSARPWVIAACMLLAGVSAFAAWPRPVMTRVEVRGGGIIGLDAHGREIWTYQIRAHVVTQSVDNGVGRTSYVGDLDGDGSPEALVSILTTNVSPDRAEAALLCFDAKGRVKWAQRLDDVVQMDGREFGPPWPGADLMVYGEPARIVFATHHLTWWPSLVVTVDPATGNRLGRFAHSGWLMRLDVTLDGQHVIAAGINQTKQAQSVAVLRQDDLSHHASFVLPRPDASEAAREPLDRQSLGITQAAVPTIRFGHSRSVHPVPETIVELSPDLRSARASFSDSYWTWHGALERSGHLQHSATECPERSRPRLEQRAAPMTLAIDHTK